jgi:recombinational DNA repair ATPase RecF
MPLHLTRFTVRNLHGQKDAVIDLTENKVILIGENGSGKSTIVNLLYYCLTRQFHRTGAYRFDSVELDLNGETFTLQKD